MISKKINQTLKRITKMYAEPRELQKGQTNKIVQNHCNLKTIALVGQVYFMQFSPIL